jgi:exodeoxyribonuclease V gamma subunit
LRDLIGFLRNPARFLLRERLGIDLREFADELGDDEPFEMEGFTASDLMQRLTDAALAGTAPQTVREVEAAMGVLPHGAVGRRVFEAAQASAAQFAGHLHGVLRPASKLAVDIDVGGTRLTGVLDGVTDRGLQRQLARDQAYPALWLQWWVEHLVLNRLRPGADSRSTLHLLKGTSELRPVDDAQSLLAALVDRFREGLAMPLHFFPRSAAAYLDAQAKGRDGMAAARFEWEGNDMKPGEGAEPYYRLAFGDSDPLDGQFETLAREVFAPLAEHRGDVK